MERLQSTEYFPISPITRQHISWSLKSTRRALSRVIGPISPIASSNRSINDIGVDKIKQRRESSSEKKGRLGKGTSVSEFRPPRWRLFFRKHEAQPAAVRWPIKEKRTAIRREYRASVFEFRDRTQKRKPFRSQ